MRLLSCNKRLASTWHASTNISNELMVKEMVLLQIEEKRQQMIELALTYGFTAKETIECSQELDQLINQYLQQTKIFESPSLPVQ